MSVLPLSITEEEKLVAELELIGVRYLSRQTNYQPDGVRPPRKLLAALVQQPSARVRASVIAVLLAHPEFAAAIPDAFQELLPAQRTTLQLYYMAAVFLQRAFADQLKPRLADRWQWLPAMFAEELNLPIGSTPRESLICLGREHQRRTGTVANWAGTCEDVARRLLRQWELEGQWKS